MIFEHTHYMHSDPIWTQNMNSYGVYVSRYLFYKTSGKIQTLAHQTCLEFPKLKPYGKFP